MKKILCFILCFTFIMGFIPQTVYASEKNEITFEEYSEALINKFKEYGRELEIEKSADNHIYTREMLREELDKADEYLRNSNPDACVVVFNESSIENDGISPKSMLGTVQAKTSNIVVFTETVVPTASCTLETRATITVDFQRDYIMSGAKPTGELLNAVNMEDYFEVKSYSTSIDNSSSSASKRSITYTINGKFKLRYSVGGATAWEKIDKTIYAVFKPFR